MKKITFYKAMGNGKFEQAQGYYYKASNGVEFVIHGNSGNWNAYELTTGGIITKSGNKTIATICKKIEQRTKQIAYVLEIVDFSNNIERIAQLRATAIQGA